jgi:hypothetical protein
MGISTRTPPLCQFAQATLLIRQLPSLTNINWSTQKHSLLITMWSARYTFARPGKPLSKIIMKGILARMAHL